jgi:hypothetical protein
MLLRVQAVKAKTATAAVDFTVELRQRRSRDHELPRGGLRPVAVPGDREPDVLLDRGPRS